MKTKQNKEFNSVCESMCTIDCTRGTHIM